MRVKLLWPNRASRASLGHGGILPAAPYFGAACQSLQVRRFCP
jgi:hypothetical protein